MSMHPKTALGEHIMIGGHLKPQTAANATAMVGAEIDRHAAGNGLAQSCIVLVHVAFTSASGATGGLNTLLVQLFHDTVTGMASEAVLDSDTYVYTWVADGANHGYHCLPVKLKAANRFIRAKATLTEAGTITISAQQVAIGVVLGGQDEAPSASFVAAGFENTTEPT